MSKKQHIELNAEEEKQDVVERWGSLLREARVARGMSVEDVSNTLHFEPKLIEAIESENLDCLPTTSFVRGYLRSYSKLLEIDAEPIVQAYSRVCGEDGSVITRVVQVKEVSSKDAGPRYATWLVVAVLAVSLIVWWWAEVLLPSAVNNETVEKVIETESVASLTVDTVSSLAPQELVVEAPEVEDEVVLAEPELEPVPEISTLLLKFSEDSWVEINDAQGKRLYMDVAKAGQTKTVAGEPPFKVLLGNAPAVTLEYNGEVYDHSMYDKKGVARFSLGK